MNLLDWPTLLVFGIAAVVYIVTYFARKAEAGRQQQRPVPRPRQSSTELERFLEEIHRQRRRQAPAPAPAKQPTVAQARRPTTQRPSQRPRPVPTAKPRQPVQPVQAVLVEEVLTLVEEAVPLAVAIERVPTSHLRSREATPVISPPKVQPAVALPHFDELRRLLASPLGIRTAFVLNEVLGPPRCRRPFRSERSGR